MEDASHHYPHFKLFDGTEISHGYAYWEWLEAVRVVLRQRFRRNHNVERRIEQVIRHSTPWDYWSSGYEPEDAAAEM